MEITDVNSLVSTAVLRKLTCSWCQNYLSYFPIYMSPDKLTICGRCSLVKEENFIRNEIYEVICEKISFPCRYTNEGCVEKVPAKKMPAHERSCTFRIVKCPTAEFTQCEWQGSRSNLLQHCHDKHSDMILKNGNFQLELSKSQKCQNLVPFKEELVMFIRDFDSTNQVLKYSVYQLEEAVSKDYNNCKIEFNSECRNLSTEEFLYSFNEKSITEISLGVLKVPYMHDEIVDGTIELVDTSQENSDFLPKAVNEELLSQLQCSVCHEYLMPPLDLYAEDQTKCVPCRKKESRGYSYPTQIKNIKLDKIANLLPYPCKYKKNGCNFTSQPPQMKIHQTDCPYENKVCPLSEFQSCEWSGLNKDVVCHVEKDHSRMIQVTSLISERLSKWASSYTQFLKCYVIKFNKHLFRLNFCYKNERFCWSVNKIGCGGDPSTFKYEIEVTDMNKGNRKLQVRQVCAKVLAKKDEIFTNVKHYCYFNIDQIESLINRDIIVFKVNIFK